MPELSDLLRRAEPPTPGFTPEDVVRRAAANRRRTWVTSAAAICLVLAIVVSVAVAARPQPTVQVITPPRPTATPAAEATVTPDPDGNPAQAGELLGAIRDLPEEEVAGAATGWRVRDGENPWWVTRGINPDGTFCLLPGTAEGVGRVDSDSDCGVVPFAITVGEPWEEMVGVVVPDGYDRATHDGATVDVIHNVAILPADGSEQPTVALIGPAGSLDVTANLWDTANFAPPQMAFDGGHAAGSAEIAAVMAEVTEPGTPAPTTARATDIGPTTTTVALRFGEPYRGSACIGLIPTGRADASCLALEEDVRAIADGPLLRAVATNGVRAYLVEDGWQTLQLPDGRQLRVTANTITVPANAESAATGLLLRDDGRQSIVALHRTPEAATGTVRTLEGLLTAYAGEPMRFCPTSAARADLPVQCPDTALQVDGLDIADVPHTVRNGDLGQFTRDPILLQGTIEDGRLVVTSVPPKISVRATGTTTRPGEVRVHVPDDGRQDFLSLGQTAVMTVTVTRAGTAAAALDAPLRVEGQPSGVLELRPLANCDSCDSLAGALLLDTTEVSIGSTYVAELPLDTGTVTVTIEVVAADDLPRPF